MRDRIAGELSAIPGLTRGELIGLWEKAHGRPPPKGLSRRLLEYSAAYQVQVKAFGGLKPMVRRKLRARAASGERTSKSTQAQCRSRALSPGTRLVREWHGVPHTVEVLEKGFFPTRARPIDRSPESPMSSRVPAGRVQGSSDYEQARPLRHLHPEVHGGGAGAGFQQPRRPARGLRGLHPVPARPGLGHPAETLRRRRDLRRDHGPSRLAEICWPTSGRGRSIWSSSTRWIA